MTIGGEVKVSGSPSRHDPASMSRSCQDRRVLHQQVRDLGITEQGALFGSVTKFKANPVRVCCTAFCVCPGYGDTSTEYGQCCLRHAENISA